MAIVKEMPSEAVIGGFKGKLDFYYWKGLAVCRSWPQSPGHSRSENVMRQWPAFTIAAKAWKELPLAIKDLYANMAQGTILTGRDVFARGYLSGWHL